MSIFTDNSERKRLEEQMRQAQRLPPHQSLTLKWPVLHEGSIPGFDPARWVFQVGGLVQSAVRLSYQEFLALSKIEITADFHCVTQWSRFDNHWLGIAARTLLELAQPLPQAQHVLVHAEQGYTANLPLADLREDNVLFATHHDGSPLTPEHGFPLRLVVPKLYAWKSVKWVRGLELLPAERPGFWEQRGYHIYGDPFREQRYTDDP